MKNKISLLLLIFVLTVFLTSTVTAFGVSAPYWSTNPMSLYPGQKTTFDLNLQNNVGDEDVTVKIEVLEGEDIVKLKKDIYTVPARTIDTMVPIEVVMARDATKNRRIALEIKTVTSGEGGMVVMGVGMKVGFDVILTEVPKEVEQKEKITLWTSIIVAIIILIIMIYLLLRRKPRIPEKVPVKTIKKVKKK